MFQIKYIIKCMHAVVLSRLFFEILDDEIRTLLYDAACAGTYVRIYAFMYVYTLNSVAYMQYVESIAYMQVYHVTWG
jgi:hypothetical protein